MSGIWLYIYVGQMISWEVKHLFIHVDNTYRCHDALMVLTAVQSEVTAGASQHRSGAVALAVAGEPRGAHRLERHRPYHHLPLKTFKPTLFILEKELQQLDTKNTYKNSLIRLQARDFNFKREL